MTRQTSPSAAKTPPQSNAEAANELLTLQDRFNQRVNLQWATAGYPWWRAIFIEAAELVGDHTPWKWWKHGALDLAQVRIEAIDILHFVLSWQVVESSDRDTQVAVISSILDFLDERHDGEPDELATWEEIADAAEDIASAALDRDLADVAGGLAQLFGLLGMNAPAVRLEYVAKNALNIVRNTLGYKEGTYIKIWDGREDNVHLEEMMALYPAAGLDELVDLMTKRYRQLNR